MDVEYASGAGAVKSCKEDRDEMRTICAKGLTWLVISRGPVQCEVHGRSVNWWNRAEVNFDVFSGSRQPAICRIRLFA